LLFFVPWFSLAIRACWLPRNAGGRTLSFLLLTMTLYSFSSFSITYFLPFWLAFGVSASLVLHTHVRANTKRVLNRSLDPWSRNVPAERAT
jgi:hypothetical protein